MKRWQAAAYVRDRAHQYDASSGIFAALCDVAALLRDGEAEASAAAGELDDLKAWASRPRRPAATKRKRKA